MLQDDDGGNNIEDEQMESTLVISLLDPGLRPIDDQVGPSISGPQVVCVVEDAIPLSVVPIVPLEVLPHGPTHKEYARNFRNERPAHRPAERNGAKEGTTFKASEVESSIEEEKLALFRE